MLNADDDRKGSNGELGNNETDDFSAGSMGGNGRTKTPYQQEPQNIIGLVAFLLLGVAAVFISFAVVALCYRLVETEYCNLQTRSKVVDRKCLIFTDTL